jgi:hypothetical protein
MCRNIWKARNQDRRLAKQAFFDSDRGANERTRKHEIFSGQGL